MTNEVATAAAVPSSQRHSGDNPNHVQTINQKEINTEPHFNLRPWNWMGEQRGIYSGDQERLNLFEC